jgi:hypothetical protein
LIFGLKNIWTAQKDVGIESGWNWCDLAERLVDRACQKLGVDRCSNQELQSVDVLGDRGPLLREVGLGLT